MSGRMYWRQQAVPVFVQVLCLCAASLYLRALGLTWLQLIPLAGAYMGGIVLWNLLHFLRKRKYFHKMAVLMESLDKKYLFPMVWKDADTWEEAGYYCLMKECTKSMLEETEEAQRLQKEYRERLETFVHDMKQPISVVSLIAGREKTQDNRAILLELEKMNHLSEQILYFGRSESSHSDFRIQKVDTGAVIRECLSMNKQLLIQNRVSLDIPEAIPKVYADEKALLFVLNQIVYNAVTYKKAGEVPQIAFSFLRKTCPGFLRKDLQEKTAGRIAALQVWGFICVKKYVTGSALALVSVPRKGSIPGSPSAFRFLRKSKILARM